MGAQRAPGHPGAWWNLGPGKVSPGTGRSAPPCSPRRSDSSHIQCISGKGRILVCGHGLGATRQSSTLPPGHFPQLPTLTTSHTELSSFPLVPLLQGDTTSPCHCGLGLWVFSSCLVPILPPHSLPGPSPIPPAPSAGPSPPSPYLQVQLRPHSLLDHCPSLLPSFLASSRPPTWPRKCLSSPGTAPAPPLLRAVPRHLRAPGQIPGTAWRMDLGWALTLQKEQ